MEKQILDIVESLTSNELPTIITGLQDLDTLLYNLLPSIKIYHQFKSHDSNLKNFINLQNNFQFNLMQYLVPIYNYDLSNENYLLLNKLVQGLLLIHPTSKKVFNISKNMKVLLDLLETNTSKELIISLISTLIHVLLKNFDNYRVFENLNGCGIIIKHFKLTSFENLQSDTGEKEKDSDNNNLNFKIIEFLMLYLLEEVNNPTGSKSIEEKSQFFIKDFPEIDSLIENLNQLNNL
ncbi:hypothetical protein SBY92_001581 [Candida maltosa Xu316]